MKLYCAFCLYIAKENNPEDNLAVTVMGGTAVCDDHLGHAHDPNVTNFLVHEKRKSE